MGYKSLKIKYLIIIALFLCGCDFSRRSVIRAELALGTDVSVRIDGMSGEKANSALDMAFARLYEIEAVASAKNPESELSFVNNNAFESAVVVSDELFFLLETGLRYSELTNGAFDITLGSVVELWGIGANNTANEREIPSEDEIANALENSGFENFELIKRESSARFLKEGLKIDLGALAKGYAADEMKRVLIENGVSNAVLNLGGDIITIGDKDGSGWLIGLANPLEPGQVYAELRVFDRAVVTSGDYERYFYSNNKRYHHIFDGKTGYPADGGIISATIIADNAAFADALSTALFVAGEDLMSVIENFPEISYILIDADMNLSFSEGLKLEKNLPYGENETFYTSLSQ